MNLEQNPTVLKTPTVIPNMKNLLTIFLLIIVQFAFGQSGSIQGTVTGEDGDTLMFATITLKKNDVVISKIQTDMNGNYSFYHLDAGIYEVSISYVGYQIWNIVKINLSEHQTQLVNTVLSLNTCCFCDIKIEQQVNINPYNLTQSTTFSADEIGRSPHKN